MKAPPAAPTDAISQIHGWLAAASPASHPRMDEGMAFEIGRIADVQTWLQTGANDP